MNSLPLQERTLTKQNSKDLQFHFDADVELARKDERDLVHEIEQKKTKFLP